MKSILIVYHDELIASFGQAKVPPELKKIVKNEKKNIENYTKKHQHTGAHDCVADCTIHVSYRKRYRASLCSFTFFLSLSISFFIMKISLDSLKI